MAAALRGTRPSPCNRRPPTAQTVPARVKFHCKDRQAGNGLAFLVAAEVPRHLIDRCFEFEIVDETGHLRLSLFTEPRHVGPDGHLEWGIVDWWKAPI